MDYKLVREKQEHFWKVRQRNPIVTELKQKYR